MTKCKTPLFPATPKGVVVSATRGGMVVSASLDHQTQCLIDARCLSEAESIREGYLVVPATLAGVVVSALLWCMVVSATLDHHNKIQNIIVVGQSPGGRAELQWSSGAETIREHEIPGGRAEPRPSGYHEAETILTLKTNFFTNLNN